MNPLLKGFAGACKPPDRRRPWEWCESYVSVDHSSPMPGRWRAENSPWVREIMDVFADARVRTISIKCSAQSAKTQTFLNLACYAVAEDPGTALWVMAAADEVSEFVRDRAEPTFTHCEPVASKMIESGKMGFVFSTMSFYFAGAGSKSKLQSKPIRWLFLDEVRNYPKGRLSIVLKRTRAFWNSKTVIISTPDKEKDAVDMAYRRGDQREFHIRCPKCDALQPLVFERLKWETSERTKPGGLWDFDLLAPTIFYECAAPECKHRMTDVREARKQLANRGQFVRMNPKAPEHEVSFHWNALLPCWVSWRSIVEEFLNARAAARGGDMSALKTFYNETMGQSWKDDLGEIDDYGFLEDRKRDYDFGEAWPDEIARFISADKQERGGEHYFYACRAFGKNGQSRLVTHGRCNTTEELEAVRVDNNVPIQNAVIDSGHKATDVYRFCSQIGWKAFKGDDPEYFLVRDRATGKTLRRVWRKTEVDPAAGTRMAKRLKPIPLFSWSNPSVKDILASYMRGLVGDWTIPKSVGSEYMRQVTAEKRAEEVGSRGEIKFKWKRIRDDNHYWDCECQIAAAAIASKVLAR